MFLPNSTILGRLELLEVYEDMMDRVFFHAGILQGRFYLAIWIEKSFDSDIWLYVPVSRKDLNMLGLVE